MATTESNLKIVNLDGEVTIHRAKEIKDKLLSAIEESPDVILNLQRVESIDVSGIQLVVGAAKEAAARGTKFRVSETIPDSVAASFRLAGFLKGNADPAFPLESRILNVGESS